MEHFFKCFFCCDSGLLYYCQNAKASYKFDIPLKDDSFLLEVSHNNTVHFYEPEIFSKGVVFFFLYT